MKLSLHKKLIIAILLSTSSVICIMLMLILWSFDKEFREHVLREEARRNQFIIESLEQEYSHFGSWDFLTSSPDTWRDLVTFGHHRLPPPDRSDHHRPPPPITHAQRVLLDKDKQLIIGSSNDYETNKLIPIKANNEIVAYLAREPMNKIFNSRQQKFINKLKKLFLSIAIVVIYISLFIAWFLSRNILKPIQRIREATTNLTAGNFETRIEVNSSDEIGELSQHFNVLANTLEKNETSRQQWVADISHELRTPLSILRGDIEAMLDGVRKIDQERMQALHKEVMSLNKLIDDLHELSMSDIGALNYEMHEHDLIEILKDSVNALANLANEKQIKIEVEEEKEVVCFVLCDEQRIQQLFNNIIINSISYTNSPGQIKIKTNIQEDNITIDIFDSAPGVASNELPKLFERLYRAEVSRNRKTGGSGLGLSICQNIIAAHNGKISAKESPLGGVWISINLPKLKD